jgi:hypothetical protein
MSLFWCYSTWFFNQIVCMFLCFFLISDDVILPSHRIGQNVLSAESAFLCDCRQLLCICCFFLFLCMCVCKSSHSVLSQKILSKSGTVEPGSLFGIDVQITYIVTVLCFVVEKNVDDSYAKNLVCFVATFELW